MAATVSILEANGAGETETASITNTNMGSTDAVNLDPVAYPVTPGANTYEKWQKFNCTNLGASSQLDTFRVWRVGALGGSATHVTNARTSSYAGAETYATPIATASSVATQAMPTSDPAAANVGVGGSLAGTITGVAKSDYVVHQIQTDAGDTAGSTSTMHYAYREIA